MRALLSVYDKAGLVDLARGLADLGWQLVSSGNTARALADEGVAVTEVAEVTGAPEMLGGRVKTLHPKIHGGILADRSNPDHVADLEARGIEPFDLVVSNLYPFTSEPSIEMIDIGGPAMVRAAAKNHAHVGVVTSPDDYDVVLDELRASGSLSEETRRRLARKAFAHTAAYDAAIVTWFDGDDVLPPTIHLALERTAEELRYGENPHQQGARYRQVGAASFWDGVVRHGDFALSYLNLYDTEAAWRLVHDVGDAPTVAIIKHANPSGVGVADDLATAYRLALECDDKSAFGGIVALNRPVDAATIDEIVEGPQADVIIALAYEGDGVERLLTKRKRTRVLEAAPPDPERRQYRQAAGSFLVQDAPHFAAGREQWRVVTRRQPTADEWRDAELAWRISGHVKSNSIVLVANGQAVGIGAGQQSRVDAAELAAKKAAGRAKGGASASDAFYPFRDGIDAAAEAGVAVVVQPGGSVSDDELIAVADELGLAMVFTGERHFLH